MQKRPFSDGTPEPMTFAERESGPRRKWRWGPLSHRRGDLNPRAVTHLPLIRRLQSASLPRLRADADPKVTCSRIATEVAHLSMGRKADSATECVRCTSEIERLRTVSAISGKVEKRDHPWLPGVAQVACFIAETP